MRATKANSILSAMVFVSFVAGGRSHYTSTKDDLSPELQKRQDRIVAETAALGNHEWAGVYQRGNGMCLQTLSLAPKAGITFTWYGCLGLYNQKYGSLVENDRRIRVKWEGPPQERDDPDADYLILKWADRRYLVPSGEILSFCVDARKQSDARKVDIGSCYLREGDEKKPVTGKPELPKGFERYLTMDHVVTTIKSTGPLTFTPSPHSENGEVVTGTVIINAGEAEGILPRMAFRTIPSNLLDSRFYVTKVRQHDSDAAVTIYQDRKQRTTPPAVGWKLTTQWE